MFEKYKFQFFKKIDQWPAEWCSKILYPLIACGAAVQLIKMFFSTFLNFDEMCVKKVIVDLL